MSNVTWERLSELVKAEADGRIVILPYTPGTVFRQDSEGEYDIIFTGKVIFETKSNEDTEWLDADEISEFATSCVKV